MTEARHAATPAKARWPWLVTLLIVLLAAGLFFWRGSGGGGAAAGATLVIGDQKGGVQSLLRAAGELDDVPYTIKFALFPAASPLLEALDAGAIDVGGIGGAPFAFAYASGAHIRAITAYKPGSENAGRASAIVVPGQSPLHGVADLKGRRLATIKGSAGQDLALRLLDRAGLKPSDVQWVYLANGESKAALATGSVDAWSTWGSYVGIAVIENGDRILADARGLQTGAGFFAANVKAIEGKEAQLADFVIRLARARNWARNHPDDYAKVLAKETGIPIDVARFSISANLGASVPIDGTLIAEQHEIFARYKAAGIIPEMPDIHGAYDSRFNKALLGPGEPAAGQ